MKLYLFLFFILSPILITGQSSKGLEMYNLKMFNEAIPEFEKEIIKLSNTKNIDTTMLVITYGLLAICYEEKNEIEESIKNYESAIEIGHNLRYLPTNYHILNVINYLNFLYKHKLITTKENVINKRNEKPR